MVEREVRYCTTDDGVRIAYCVEGEGPPLLVCPFFFESFALESLVPEHRLFMQALGDGRTLIRTDQGGSGLSQRDHPYTLDSYVGELEAIITATKVKDVSIWSPANMRAVTAFTVRHPELVRRLIIYGSANLDPNAGFSPEVIAAFRELPKGNWAMASHMFADLIGRTEFPEVTARVGEWYEQSVTGEEVGRLLAAGAGVDVRPLLGKIQCPTLVLHRLNDPLFSFDHARSLASLIPDARLVPLEGNVWAFFLQDSQSILDAVSSFLDEDSETRRLPVTEPSRPRGTSGTFRTVLFTDLVGHTEMMSRLGDERGRAVLRVHERITRELLRAHGGTEVKTMGDGFMASFGSVTKAVECAVALQKAFEERNRGEGVDRGMVRAQHEEDRRGVSASGRDPVTSDEPESTGAAPLRKADGSAVEPISIRVGLNAGEPIEEEGPDGRSDLFGATVIMASRIAARAKGSEILVSDNVRSLCSGKGFTFADRGEFAAKGFEEPVRVYEVRWRES